MLFAWSCELFTEMDVIRNSHFIEEIVILQTHLCNKAFFEKDLPFVWFDKTGYHVYNGTLAGTIMAQQPKAFTLVDLKIYFFNPSNSLTILKCFANSFYLNSEFFFFLRQVQNLIILFNWLSQNFFPLFSCNENCLDKKREKEYNDLSQNLKQER